MKYKRPPSLVAIVIYKAEDSTGTGKQAVVRETDTRLRCLV